MPNVHTISQKMQKRASIMKAAMILFKSDDYNEITISQVAKQANVAKGTVFSYFDTKEDLFMTILLEGYQNYFNELISKINQNGKWTITDYVKFMLNSTNDLVDNHPTLLRLNSLRGPILEGKANMDETIKQRNRLYQIQEDLGDVIEQRVGKILTGGQLGHLFLIQSGIISGIMNMNALNQFNHQDLSITNYNFNVNITKEAVRQMKYYLNGYLKEFGKNEQ